MMTMTDTARSTAGTQTPGAMPELPVGADEEEVEKCLNAYLEDDKPPSKDTLALRMYGVRSRWAVERSQAILAHINARLARAAVGVSVEETVESCGVKRLEAMKPDAHKGRHSKPRPKEKMDGVRTGVRKGSGQGARRSTQRTLTKSGRMVQTHVYAGAGRSGSAKTPTTSKGRTTGAIRTPAQRCPCCGRAFRKQG